MTKYLTGFDLIDRITQIGLEPVTGSHNVANITVFGSEDQMKVSRAQAVLFEQGFTFLHGGSLSDGTQYMTLKAPGNGYPERIELQCRHATGRPPRLALCYLDDGKLAQFTLPYRWSVRVQPSDESRELLQAFEAKLGNIPHWWIAILKGSTVVHI